MGFFFFLNKNKPKGLLGIVVPAACLASPAPEEYGCMKRLDHTSRRAPRFAFPPSLSFSASQSLLRKRDWQTFGEGWAESREVRELAGGLMHSGRRCWEEAVAGLPQPYLTPSVLFATEAPGGLGWGSRVDSSIPSIHFMPLPA